VARLSGGVAEVVQRDRAVPAIADALGELGHLLVYRISLHGVSSGRRGLPPLAEGVGNSVLVAGGGERRVGLVGMSSLGCDVADALGDHGGALVCGPEQVLWLPGGAGEDRVEPRLCLGEAAADIDKERKSSDQSQRQ